MRAVHCPAGVQGHRVHQSWLHLRGDACSLFHGCSHVPRPPGDVTQVSPCILQGVYRPRHLVGWPVRQVLDFRQTSMCLTLSTQENCLTDDTPEVVDVLVVVWTGKIAKTIWFQIISCMVDL